MTVTFPTITFPHRGVEAKDAFVLAQEEAQDTLSGAMTDALELFVEQANELELNVTEIELNVTELEQNTILFEDDLRAIIAK